MPDAFIGELGKKSRKKKQSDTNQNTKAEPIDTRYSMINFKQPKLFCKGKSANIQNDNM